MPGHRLQVVPAGPGDDALRLMEPLRRALSGQGPALLPRSTTGTLPAAVVGDDIAAVVTTSGSTGAPKHVLLTAANLVAGAESTAQRLGGHGQWVLALPVHHVAGLQVLVRSVLAGTEPVAVDASGGFAAAAFVAATHRLDGTAGRRRYTALVPTQLARLLRDEAAVAALRTFDAVLVGGSSLPSDVHDAARGSGVRTVVTYGMTETAGGCVYDGVPLHGVRVDVAADGRISVGGPVVAVGYLGVEDGLGTVLSGQADPTGFFVADGIRWFRTSDLGRWQGGQGRRLLVEARMDDVVVTGGLKVHPAPVEEALRGLPGVGDALVTGVPDSRWGQAVGALLVASPGQHVGAGVAEVRSQLRGRLPGHALPRVVAWVGAVPLTTGGKPDRRAAATIIAQQGTYHE